MTAMIGGIDEVQRLYDPIPEERNIRLPGMTDVPNLTNDSYREFDAEG